MIKIYKDGKCVQQYVVENSEKNQKIYYGLFIASNKIKTGKSDLPLLDLYTKILRENGYSAEGF